MNYIVRYEPERWVYGTQNMLTPAVSVITICTWGRYLWDGPRLCCINGTSVLPRRNPLRARVIAAMKRTLQDGKKRVVRP